MKLTDLPLYIFKCVCLNLGPDHLAALIPSSVGRSGWSGVRIGAIWGLGHGVSAFILGMSFFFLKGQFTGRFAVLEKLANLAESAVGLSLVAIGIIGIKENMDSDVFERAIADSKGKTAPATLASPPEVVGLPNKEAAAIAVTSTGEARATGKSGIGGGGLRSSRAILANGMLHGFSWDGAPSIAPAVAMSSWRAAVTFLLAYSVGTMLAMSAAAGLLGELSMRLGKAYNDPRLPHKLSFGSSVLAIAIGIYWLIH